MLRFPPNTLASSNELGRALVLAAAFGLSSSAAGQDDVISREVSVRFSPDAPQDVLSREITVRFTPPAPVDVISREISVFLPNPDLAASVPVIMPATIAKGAFLQVDWTVTISGSDPESGWSDAIYLSVNTTAGDADDVLLQSFAVPQMPCCFPGIYQGARTIYVPTTVPEGAYYLYVKTDDQNVVAEQTSETDNVAFAVGQADGGSAGRLHEPDLPRPRRCSSRGVRRADRRDDLHHRRGPRFASLHLRNGSVVTHTAGYEQSLSLSVSTDATIEAGSSIVVSGKGHPGGQGPGTAPWKSLFPPAYGTDAGGGYGGYGASQDPSDLTTLGPSYGSLLRPRRLGSGGNGLLAGAGGGAISLKVGGMLTLDGDIVAGGAIGSTDGGAGSGGSVFVRASSIVGTGSMRADGGAGSLWLAGSGGGGGGRIHVVSDDRSGWAGLVSAYGGDGAGAFGGAGTIVLVDTTTGDRDLIVKNFQPGLVMANEPSPHQWAFTELPGDLKFTTIVIDDGVRLWSPRSKYGLTLRASGDVTLGPGAALWAEALGFGVHEGPGASPSFLVGASHGGLGGIGSGSTFPNPTYGLDLTPVLPGCGKPSSNVHGGGAIVVEAQGSLILDGYVNSRGDVGGGSGGSILLAGNAIGGTGTVTARGETHRSVRSVESSRPLVGAGESF